MVRRDKERVPRVHGKHRRGSVHASTMSAREARRSRRALAHTVKAGHVRQNAADKRRARKLARAKRTAPAKTALVAIAAALVFATVPVAFALTGALTAGTASLTTMSAQEANWCVTAYDENDKQVLVFLYSEDEPTDDSVSALGLSDVDEKFPAHGEGGWADIEGMHKSAWPWDGADRYWTYKVVFHDTVKPKSCSYWFYGFDKLTEIDLSNLDTSEVTTCEGMFLNCPSLTTVTGAGSLVTSTVTSTADMFHGCSSLAAIDMGGWDMSGVASTYRMFKNCSALPTPAISGWNTSAVRDAGWMFANCVSMAQGVPASSWNMRNADTTDHMFRNVPAMGSVDLSSWRSRHVRAADVGSFEATRANWAAYCEGDHSLTFLYSEAAPTSVDGVPVTEAWYGGDGGWAEAVPLRSGRVSPSIPWSDHRVDITEVRFNDVTSPMTVAGWFDCFTSMTSFTAPANLDTWRVESFTYMFRDCSFMTTCDLSNLDTGNAVTMNGMFSDCYSLSSVNLSNMVTMRCTKFSSFFYGCTAIDYIDVSSWDTSNYEYGGGSSVFMRCENLTTIKLGLLWEPANISLMTEGNAATQEWRSLTHPNLPVTPGYMFQYDWDADTYAGTWMLATATSNWIVYSEPTQTLYFLGFPVEPTTELVGFEVSQCWQLEDLSDTHFESADDVPWKGIRERAVRVVFAANMQPKSTAWWFAGFKNLVSMDDCASLMNGLSETTSMAHMFDGCRALKSWNWGGVNLGSTTKLTDISYMFAGCSSLDDAHIDKLYLNNVKTVAHLFDGCTSLTGSDLSFTRGYMNRLDSVEDFSYMFHGCASITSIGSFSIWGSATRNVSHMFDGCYALTDVLGPYKNGQFGSWDVSNVTDFSYMFAGCASIEYLPISNNVRSSHPTSSAYYYTSDATYAGWKFTSAENMSHMFDGCEHLRAVKCSMAAGYNYPTDEVRAYNIENDLIGLAGRDTQSNQESFWGVNPYEWNTSHVTDMSYMFRGCRAMDELNTSQFDIRNVTDFEGMFEHCVNIRSADLSGRYGAYKAQDTANVARMFFGCTALESIDVSGISTANATGNGAMESVFTGCTALRSVTFGDGWSHWGDWSYLPAPSTEGSFTGKWVNNSKGSLGPLSSVQLYDQLPADAAAYAGTWIWEGSEANFATYSSTDKTLTFHYSAAYPTKSTFGKEVTDSVYGYRSSSPWLTASPEFTEWLDSVPGEDNYYVDYVSAVYGGDSDYKCTPWGSYTYRNGVNKVVFLNTCKPKSTSYWFDSLYRNSSDANANVVTFEGLEKLDMSNVEYAIRMFASSNAFASPLDLRALDVSNVKYMTGMFSGVTIGEINLTGWDTSNVIAMDGMFAQSNTMSNGVQCGPTKVLQGFTFNNCETVRGMFYKCRALRELSTDFWSLPKVRHADYMFQDAFDSSAISFGDTEIRHIDTSNFGLYNCETTANMFAWCQGLDTIDTHSWFMPRLRSAANMFAFTLTSCAGVDVSGWNPVAVEDLSGMFEQDMTTTTIDMSGWGAAETLNIERMCMQAYAAEQVTIGSWSQTRHLNAYRAFYNCRCEQLNFGGMQNCHIAYGDLEEAFKWASELRELNVAGWILDASDGETREHLASGLNDTMVETTMKQVFEGAVNLRLFTVGSGWTTWTDNSYLPEAANSQAQLEEGVEYTHKWKNLADSTLASKTHVELYDELPSHAEAYSGTWFWEENVTVPRESYTVTIPKKVSYTNMPWGPVSQDCLIDIEYTGDAIVEVTSVGSELSGSSNGRVAAKADSQDDPIMFYSEAKVQDAMHITGNVDGSGSWTGTVQYTCTEQ